jgi:hypothetical protein
MGILEDAIREHLDLKRKHGAPEQELERQEVEALGPARREPAAEDAETDAAPVEGEAADAVQQPDLASGVEEPLAQADDQDEVALDPTEAAIEVPFGEEPQPAETDEPELPPDPPLEAQAPVVDELPPEAELEPQQEDPPPAPPSAYSSTVDQPTQHFDVEEAFRAEDEDVRGGDTPARGIPAQEPEEERPFGGDEPFAEDEPFADEDAPADESEAAEGDPADVLEDTPDFLQDAPEHDRLWFEQKPPRDFDFD